VSVHTERDRSSVHVELPYGRSTLAVELPGSTFVVAPQDRPAAEAGDALLAVKEALANPVSGPALRDVVAPGARVAVAVCDGTRPQPREPMLRALVDELVGKVRPEDITVLVATGTHRANTPAELREMFGPELLDLVRVLNHDARDHARLVHLGTLGAGVPAYLNREFAQADVKVTTGFVEPHFFAGFSGGPKLVAPGLAGLETTLALHDARRIGDPKATWGVTEGNPVHDDVRAIARAAGVSFACDVVLNRKHEVAAVFAGELFAMHQAAVSFAREISVREVPEPFDVVVTSNAGYPLDQNLYQCVKGMSAAAQIVKPGGLVVLAAECRDGFPDHGEFRRLLASASTPGDLLSSLQRRRETVPDQWQAQILARVLTHARVAVYTEGLRAPELKSAFLQPAEDISVAVAEEMRRVGPGATCCALPSGPETIATVAPRNGAATAAT